MRLRTVFWRVSMVSAMALLAVSVDCSKTWAEQGYDIKAESETVTIRSGDRRVLRYRYDNVAYKPYVDRLYTPAGVNVLRDSPSDHKHHHALMFAIKVDGTNFWEEQQAPGTQRHRAFTQLQADSTKGVFSELLEWQSVKGKTVLLEERHIDVVDQTAAEVTLLTWSQKFSLPKGAQSAKLTGSHYHGLGMRFAKSMDHKGVFKNADGLRGEIVRGDERLTPGAWCAYFAEANSHPVTVAMFTCAENPRPTLWFTMGDGGSHFSYLAASLNLHREPLVIQAGNVLEQQFGVALWDGHVTTDRIKEVYEAWLETP